MENRNILSVCLLCIMLPAIIFFCIKIGFAEMPDKRAEKIKIYVSILPQKYFVERIGGKRVDVSVMVGKGQSPATYEPLPRQVLGLGKSKLYFRIGVPFETVWMDRIVKSNPGMKVIDMRRGIELIPMKSFHRRGHKKNIGRSEGRMDPHIWNSLRLVNIQAKTICDALITHDKDYKKYYQNNLRAFSSDLDKLDAEISGLLNNLYTNKFMVFHPAWGYFARDYGLEQIPVEIQGKMPGAKDLDNIIKMAKKENIKVIFVQKQFSIESARAIADAIGGKIIQVDPLAEDYLGNMKKIGETFMRALK